MSSTTLFLDFKSFCTNAAYYDVTGGTTFFETGFSVSDMDANTTTIELRGENFSGGTETVTAEQMVVTYFKK